MKATKYEFIDALRGIAFLGVLACHVGQKSEGINRNVLALLDNGDKGVQLFFLLSALTLFLSLDNRKDESSRALLSFFFRRFFRIAPLFYLGVFVYTLLAPLLRNDPTAASVPAAAATFAFVHGWSPYWINHVVPGGWSIAVEMNFYLFVPWLFGRLRTLDRALGFALATCALAAGVHYLGNTLLRGPIPEPILRSAFLRWWLPNQLPAFALGFVLYHVLRGRIGLSRGSEFARAVLAAAAAGYFFVGLVLAGIDKRCFVEVPLYGGAIFLFAYALALYPLRAFVNPLSCYLGKVSFSCYLVHFAVLRTVDRVLPGLGQSGLRLIALSALTIAGTVALATVTYHLVEVPGQALGRRLFAGMKRRPTEPCTGLELGTLGSGM